MRKIERRTIIAAVKLPKKVNVGIITNCAAWFRHQNIDVYSVFKDCDETLFLVFGNAEISNWSALHLHQRLNSLRYIKFWLLQLVTIASCFYYMGPLLYHLVAFSDVKLLVAFSYKKLDYLCHVGYQSPLLSNLNHLCYRTFVALVGHFHYVEPLSLQ